MGVRFAREQRHICGANYQEVDLYPITEKEHNASVRAKKKQASRLVQQNLNAKNAKRYFVQLLNTNFDENDMHVTCTYDDEHLPADEEAANHDLTLFMRRLASACRRSGAAAPLLVAVTEWQEEDEKHKAVRFHHHIILKCALSRDEIESLWYGKDKKRMGYVNADRLQLDRQSLERLAGYLLKYPNRKRRWRQSRGLKKPQRPRPNDSKYTRRKIAQIVRSGDVYDPQFWAAKYPEWIVNDAEPVLNEITGEWSIYLKMRRRNIVHNCETSRNQN